MLQLCKIAIHPILRRLFIHLQSFRAFQRHFLINLGLFQSAQSAADKRKLCRDQAVIFDKEIFVKKPIQHLILHNELTETVHILKRDHRLHDIRNTVLQIGQFIF